MLDLVNLNTVRNILNNAKTIAVVGLSPKNTRPSNMVARYLIEVGYTVFPVNPGHDEILGLRCYPDLLSLPQKIDIVDIFRRAEEVPAIVEKAIIIGAKTIWMQQGIINEKAAGLAKEHSMQVIMDRCIKIDHTALKL